MLFFELISLKLKDCFFFTNRKCYAFKFLRVFFIDIIDNGDILYINPYAYKYI